MARSDNSPLRAFASAAAILMLCSLPGRASAQAGSTPAVGTEVAGAPADGKPEAVKPTAGRPRLTDAQRAAAKLKQHKPVMAVAAPGAKYPWAGGKPVTSKGYAVTVSASRPSAPAAAKPVTATPRSTVAAGSAPSQAGATFQQRMARTTVTPPVMANGPKAANTMPSQAAPRVQIKGITPALALTPSKPKSPPLGAKQAWHFRQVATVSSSTSKVTGRVALSTVKATATHAPIPAKTQAAVTAKPVPTPQVAAKPVPTPVVAVIKTAPKPPPVAASVTPAAPVVKLASVQSTQFKSVEVGRSTASASVRTMVKTTVATAAKSTTKSKAPTVVTLAAQSVPVAKLTIVEKTRGTASAKRPAKALTTSVASLGARFMEQRQQYVYNSLNRRDPYASLVSGSFEGEVGTPLLDVSSMKLVGIVWGASDRFALVEDGHGHGFVLRVGDPVLNGYIAGLTKEELIVKQSSYGDTQTVTIQLQRKEGASNAQ